MTTFEIILCILIGCVPPALIISSFLYMMRERKKPKSPPVEKQLRVTVVDQWCDTALRGSQTLHLQKQFCTVFRDEYGNTHEIPVWEEIYPVFQKDQTGILTLIDGEFYSFEADA